MKISTVYVLGLAGLLTLSVATQAKEYYVSPKGNDTNSGVMDLPFKTIQKAANLMVAGDVCFIREGVYHEMVIPKNTGTEGKPIRFEAYKGENMSSEELKDAYEGDG